MKKILFLVNTHKGKYNAFVEAGKKVGVEVSIRLYSDVYADFSNQSISSSPLKIKNCDLDSVGLIYLRTLIKTPELQMMLSQACKTLNIPIIDSVFNYQAPFIDGKAFTYQKLVQANLPVIDSFFVNSLNELENKNLEFPVIAKTSGGSQGKDVHLCHNKQELKNIFSQYEVPLLVQPYIENDGDLRLHIIGSKFVAAIKRSSQTDEFRNNTSLGGKAVSYQPSQKEIDIALKAAQILGYEIAGVDLIFNQKKSEWLIMEINRAPQFSNVARTSGIDIPLETIKYFKTLI